MVHYQQKYERDEMKKGIARDIERRNAKAAAALERDREKKSS